MRNSSSDRNISLRRTAGEAKKYAEIKKILTSLLICLVVLTVIAYIVSVLYTKYGSFTVSVNKFDQNKYSLTLSETPDFNERISRLNAKMALDITNISENDLPGDVDSINGSHNGQNYLAYTFYLKNSGSDTVSFSYDLFITNVTNDVDKAIRFKVFRDGEGTTFARTRGDGGGAEYGTTEFLSSRDIVREQVDNFAPGDTTKFTVVIWVEGNDVDCVDSIIGGTLKSDMIISVIETSADGTSAIS